MFFGKISTVSLLISVAVSGTAFANHYVTDPDIANPDPNFESLVRPNKGFSSPVHNYQFQPGQQWNDSDGVHINAHGFNIVHHDDVYYWFGSSKRAGRAENQNNERGVSCYTSTDLLNWDHQGLVLDRFAEGMHEEVADAGILDRPKVVFNDKTGKFVMYFKLYEPGARGGVTGTRNGWTGVAQSDTPCGTYEYKGRFLAANSDEGSGDFAIYKDDDGHIYHITVHKPTKWLHLGKMADDGLRPAEPYIEMEGIARATEAPAIVKHEDKYYLLGSGSTSWDPNAARMFVADSLEGPWEFLGNPLKGTNPYNGLNPRKSFGGQSTFILDVPGKDDSYIAMFDINNEWDPINAGYIWLPLEFTDNGPLIEWRNQWDMSEFD